MKINFIKTETVEKVDVSQYDCPDSVLPAMKQLDRAYAYEAVVGRDRINVTFHTRRARDCDAFAQVAGTILKMLLPYRHCPTRHVIQATVLLCDCVKRMPKGAVFGQDHVNTGYAQKCADKPLVVYREEEWVKVFIHECFHYLNLDKGLSEVQLPMFQVPNPVALSEAFAEVWARIINCHMTAAATNTPVAALVEKEREYAVYNMVKVLAHMGFTFADLTTGRAAQYAENTNVFAYIVLGAILLNDPQEFVTCFKGFKATNAKLLQLIRKQMGSTSFAAELKRQEAAFKRAPKTTRMRMSIVDLFYLLNV